MWVAHAAPHDEAPVSFAAQVDFIDGVWRERSRRPPSWANAGSEPVGAILLQALALCSTSLKYVLLRQLRLQWSPHMRAASILFWLDLTGFTLLVPAALISGELNTLVDSLQRGGPILSALTVVGAVLGGIHFLMELVALRHVDAVDLSASNTLAALLAALICAVGAAMTGQFSGESATLLLGGGAFTLAALGAYASLSSLYGRARIARQCGRGCLRGRQYGQKDDRFSATSSPSSRYESEEQRRAAWEAEE
jgi:hypothetical protein